MNYRVERIRGRPGRLREMGDRLTGGGVRALIQRLFRQVRHTGDRLTGGGLRSLSSRMATKLLRIAMSQSFLMALGRSALQPFPNFSARLYRLACGPDTVATASRSPLPRRDYPLLVNSLYRAAFGRLAEESGLEHHVRALQSGTALQVLAEHLVRSPEFQTRHGSSQEVDIKYITALYRDGLGCEPELENLASWLGAGKKGATRAKVLAGVAASD